MNLDNQNLEQKLCDAYFSILEMSLSMNLFPFLTNFIMIFHQIKNEYL